jgi:hypothetical protein
MNEETKYTVERASETSRWSMTFTTTLAEAKAYIGSAEHWRITDHTLDKVVEQSEGELPSIFNRGKEPQKPLTSSVNRGIIEVVKPTDDVIKSQRIKR